MGERLVPVRNENTRWATGLCLDPHDLLLSKHVAGRDKDRRFVREAVAQGWFDRDVLEERLGTMSIGSEVRQLVAARIASDFEQA